MTAVDVHAVHSAMVGAALNYWITGGWGVDALLGTQTRKHADLDISVPSQSLQATLDVFAGLGYQPETDWLPTRVAVRDTPGREVDVHPLVFEDDGSAWLPGPNKTRFDYPADSFVHGSVASVVVPCISAALQVVLHSGYSPTAKDLADMRSLRSAGLIPARPSCGSDHDASD